MSDLKIEVLTYYQETNGDYRKGVTALSIHLKRLKAYNSNWKLRDILVFEALLIHGKKHGFKNFYYYQEQISEDCRITKYAVGKAIKKLKKLNIITFERKYTKEKKGVNFYTINFEVIRDNLTKIYDFNKFHEDMRNVLKTTFTNFYNYFEKGKFYAKEGEYTDTNQFLEEEPKFQAADISSTYEIVT